MNCFRSKLFLESPVHQLVLTDFVQTIKSRGHHTDLEVVSTTGEILNAHLSVGDGTTDRGAEASGWTMNSLSELP